MSKADMAIIDVNQFDLAVIKKSPSQLNQFKNRIKATEILSDTVTRILTDPEDFFTRDPEHFSTALGLLQNLK